MENAFSRLLDAAGCRTKMELASLLGVRQALIHDAQKRCVIPGEWLESVCRLRGIEQEWIRSGQGPKYAARPAPCPCPDACPCSCPEHRQSFHPPPGPSTGADPGPESLAAADAGQTSAADSLRHFSTRALAEELLRRAGIRDGAPDEPDCPRGRGASAGLAKTPSGPGDPTA